MSYYHYDPLATIKAEIEKIKAEGAKKEAEREAAEKAVRDEQNAILVDGLRQIFEAVGIEAVPIESQMQVGEYMFHLAPRNKYFDRIERNYFQFWVSTETATADPFNVDLNFGNPQGDIDAATLRRNIALAIIKIEHQTAMMEKFTDKDEE